MPYRHIIAYIYCRFLIEGVKHGTVLYVHPVAYRYGIDVATKHGVEPNAAFVAHSHIAYDRCVFSEETIAAYHWSVSAQRYYQSHSILMRN